MALALIVTYLEMNRLSWKCGEVDETAMVLRAAAGGNEGRRVGSVGNNERGEEGLGIGGSFHPPDYEGLRRQCVTTLDSS